MFDLARTRLAFAGLATAAALAGCMTPQAKPQLSQAVLDARAHRDAPVTAACPDVSLSTLTPVAIGFAFNDTELTEGMTRLLEEPTRWLVCHRAVSAVIRPDADGHGTEAEQDALARRRAEGVQSYLSARGVTAGQIRILRRGEAEPTGDVLLIRAEGRRW
jgi:outer membrane protein OmpA-like peptidoglycan-associated protein